MFVAGVPAEPFLRALDLLGNVCGRAADPLLRTLDLLRSKDAACATCYQTHAFFEARTGYSFTSFCCNLHGAFRCEETGRLCLAIGGRQGCWHPEIRSGGCGPRRISVLRRPMALPMLLQAALVRMRGVRRLTGRIRKKAIAVGQLGKQLSPEKQRIIKNGPFGDLLDIQPFKVPHELIEFVVMFMNHTLREFKYKNKSINFSKLMVRRTFNVPSGDRPMKLLKKSDEHDLHNIYKEGNMAPITHVIKLLKDCNDEDGVMINRTWALIVLAIVVCPGTGNMVNLEYLASLEDMSLVRDLAWDEHLLKRAMEEVAVFQEKKRMQATTENPAEFQIRSCLPMLVIIYMDNLDIPAGLPNKHVIDYSVLRIRLVCQKDFVWVDKVDKNKLTLTSLSTRNIHNPGFYATHCMPHNLWDKKLVLKQPVGRELVLKQLVVKEAKFKVMKFKQRTLNKTRLNQMLRLNHTYHHRSMIGCNIHSLAYKI
ncbi:uncharacterized protein [Aegilops tauschii subsp. strangulata]|uniref:uncharacterized protein n=1 Tax=Aegilops tauschii subsp. strangulata TaxID=200361 RepID=UPI001ABD2CD5|nr:uncharacterized protein LOC109770372 [Aegilops tauschii subsp. strangulata]